MKKILIVFILLLAMLPCAGKSINMTRHALSHKGIAHVPTVIGNEASYEDETILVSFSKYVGNFHLYIYNENNTIVKEASKDVTQGCKVTVTIADLPHGVYTLEVALDNGTYVGTFEIAD